MKLIATSFTFEILLKAAFLGIGKFLYSYMLVYQFQNKAKRKKLEEKCLLSQDTREWAIHSNVNQELIALSRLAIGTQSPAFCRHGWHT